MGSNRSDPTPMGNISTTISVSDLEMDTLRYFSYGLYLITVWGCASNLLALYVLLRSQKIHTTVYGRFLIALSTSDTVALITTQIASLIIGEMPAGHLTCVTILYLMYVSQMVSTFVIVCISGNRFVVVVYPTSSGWLSRPRNGVLMIVTVTVIAAAMYIFSLFTFTSKKGKCQILTDQQLTYFIGILVADVIVRDLIAGTIIFVLSMCTIFALRTSGQRLANTKAPGGSERCGTLSRHRRDEERQVTVLLLVVAFTYLLLRLPYSATWVPQHLQNFISYSQETIVRLNTATNITTLIAMTNHGINLYLYCLGSKIYRQEIRKYVLPICAPSRHRNSKGAHPPEHEAINNGGHANVQCGQ